MTGMRIAIFVSVLIFILIPVHGQEAQMDDKFYIDRAKENLEVASRWLIEKGMKEFSSDGVSGVKDKVNRLTNFGVQLWTDSLEAANEDADRNIVEIRIKSREIYYGIRNLYREKINDEYYEFWLIQIYFNIRSEAEPTRSKFFVTKSSAFFGDREIIEENDQFIDSYQVGEVAVSFPTDDLSLLFWMGAWHNPQNYVNTDFGDKEVGIDSEGNYFFKTAPKKSWFSLPW